MYPQAPLVQVFVYGTLKPGQLNYQRYCAANVVEVSPAIAQGQLFKLPAGYPAMTLGASWVQGFVLSFSDANVLRDMDDYEDYQQGRSPCQNLYERQVIATFSLISQPLGFAWAYLMSLDKVHHLGGTLLAAGRWD